MVNIVGLVIIDNYGNKCNMLTRAQKYLLEGAKEQMALAEKEIPKLYKEFHKAKVSKEVFPDVYEGMMHTIGYWECLKNTCQSVINMIQMTYMKFREFELEQERIRIYNEKMKEEILKSIKEVENAEKKQSEEE